MIKKKCIICGKIMNEDHTIDKEEGYIYSYYWGCDCGTTYEYWDKEGNWYDEFGKKIIQEMIK